MVNIEESQNTTVITGNTKLMMRIAGVLFAVLAVIHITRNFNPENIHYIITSGGINIYYYINIAFLIIMEMLFSIACIIQKKVFFIISSLIVIGLFLMRIVY